MNHQGHGLLLYIISLIHSSCYKSIWGGGGGGRVSECGWWNRANLEKI